MDGDRPVGIAAGYHDPENDAPHERNLVSMWIAPSHRGRGIVELLVAAVADWARDDGATALRLEVAVGNEVARRAYTRLGFVPTGAPKPMPRQASILEQAMVLHLRPAR